MIQRATIWLLVHFGTTVELAAIARHIRVELDIRAAEARVGHKSPSQHPRWLLVAMLASLFIVPALIAAAAATEWTLLNQFFCP